MKASLDRALADGVRPNASPALELRAERLSRPSVAAEVGDELRAIVTRAHSAPRPGIRVEACRDAVLAIEHEMRLLASRLEASNPVSVIAVAKVNVLLSDGTGPLYYPDPRGELRVAIRDATAALG
jgi:hypothetical protein